MYLELEFFYVLEFEGMALLIVTSQEIAEVT